MKKGSIVLTVLGVIAIIGFGSYALLGINYINEEVEKIQSEVMVTQTLIEDVLESRELGGNNAVGGKLYFLGGSGVSATQTTIPLTKFEIAGGTQKIRMADFGDLGCGTLEPGNQTKQEFVSFTGVTQNGDGTATLTGVTRGLSPIPDYTASSTLEASHPGGSRFVVSNSPPCFFEGYAQITQDETITGLWTFSGAIPIVSLTATTSLQVANKAYVDNVTAQGAATSTETNGGIVELGTALEAASSTDGGANKPLVLQTKYATDTPSMNADSATSVIMSDLTGYIKQGWINLTEAFTVTGNWIFNTGTVTFNNTVDIEADAAAPFTINTQAYVFPSADGTASSTSLCTDGSGNLSFCDFSSVTLYATSTFGVLATDDSTTTLATFSLPANTITLPNDMLRITTIGDMDLASGTCWFDVRLGTGAASSTIGSIRTDSIGSVHIETTMSATTTTSQRWTGESREVPLGITDPDANLEQSFLRYTTTDLTAQAYIDVQARNDSSANCALIGFTIERLRQQQI